MNGLDGRTALVTGATGLIGGAVVRRLAGEGCRVVVASRSEDRARAWIATEPEALRASLVPLALDLASTDAIAAAVNGLVDALGTTPDILICSASLRDALLTPQAELGHAQFEALFGADVAGHYFCARTLVERLAAGQGASLVWLSSVYAVAGVDRSIYPPGMSGTPVHYAAVKSAIHGLVAHLAAQWGPRSVRVNAVVSGGVRARDRQNEEFVERYSRKTMLGRMAGPDEIAASVVFLASAEASYVTGTCLVVDGGFTAW